jgi:hypothetical protein
MTSIWIVRYRLDPFPGIDLIKQHLDWIIGGDGDLHRLPRSSVSAIKQLADCSNPGSLALRSQRQAGELDDRLRSMLARQFLDLAENLGAPTRIATRALTKFHFFLISLLPTCSEATHEPRAQKGQQESTL